MELKVIMELSNREDLQSFSFFISHVHRLFDEPLDYWIDVDEIETLDLMWLQDIWALHLRQNFDNPFDQGTKIPKLKKK